MNFHFKTQSQCAKKDFTQNTYIILLATNISAADSSYTALTLTTKDHSSFFQLSLQIHLILKTDTKIPVATTMEQEKGSSSRPDVLMAEGTTEDRLRRLEAAHSIRNLGDNNSPILVCNASLLHTEQISELGTEYNKLEEAIHALEQANNNKEERIRELERHLNDTRGMESSKLLDNNTNKTKKAETSIARPGTASSFLSTPTAGPDAAASLSCGAVLSTAQPGSAVSPLAGDLESQKALIQDVARRLALLESSQPSSVTSYSTHQVTQDLVRRLGNGDMLERTLRHQLESSLSGDRSPLTPAPTDSARRESTVSAEMTPEPRQKQALIKTRKRSLVGPADDEPPQKRRRGRPLKNSLSNTSTDEPPTKRLRGRPPLHGRYSRKSSYGSTASVSSSVAASKTRLSVSQQAEVLGKKKSTASKPREEPVSESTQSDEAANDAGGEELSEISIDHLTKGSDRSIYCPTTASPNQDVQPLDENSNHLDHVGNDESIAVATKTRNTTTPKSKTRGLDVRSASPSSAKLARTSSTPYRDPHTPNMAAMDEGGADGISIPPERRSGRTPKRPQLLGDHLSWKEVLHR